MTGDLLGGLTDDQRRSVTARLTRHPFRRGDILFVEGERGDTLHIVQRGTVAVQATTPRGDVVTLSVLGAGAAFGEQALVAADSRRTATVVALEAGETRMLHRADFDDLRSRYPAVDRFLVELLASHLRRASQDLVEALFVAVEDRLVKRLVELTDLYASQRAIGPDTPVAIPVRQEDLATMIGSTRPTTNKNLRMLADRGIVSLSRGSITVSDRAGLRTLVTAS